MSPRRWRRRPAFRARAKRLIQLFMPGGPSQVDTFDYKPMIAKHAGERPACVDRRSLRNTKMGLMPSPFGFQQYGQCGKWVSDIFPEVAQCVDDICFVHSMHTDIPEHAGGHPHDEPRRAAAESAQHGRMADLRTRRGDGEPARLRRHVPSRAARGQLANWGNAFLPGAYAGTYVNIEQMTPDAVLPDLKNPGSQPRSSANSWTFWPA